MRIVEGISLLVTREKPSSHSHLLVSRFVIIQFIVIDQATSSKLEPVRELKRSCIESGKRQGQRSFVGFRKTETPSSVLSVLRQNSSQQHQYLILLSYPIQLSLPNAKRTEETSGG